MPIRADEPTEGQRPPGTSPQSVQNGLAPGRAPAVKFCSNYLATMAKFKQGHHTDQSVTWAIPTAYDKKEVGETAGDSAPNDGPRPDSQRQRLEMRRFASWNVGNLTGKGKELVDEMKRRRIDIMGIQEIKWGGNSARGTRRWVQSDIQWRG